jgi:hypothetical protein
MFHRMRHRHHLRTRLRPVHEFDPIRPAGHRPGGQRNQRHLLGGGMQQLPKAGPSPVFRPLDHLGTQRIALHIPRHRRKVDVVLHRERLVPALIHRPHSHPMAVFHPPPHVRDRQPLHETGQFAILPRPKNQVPMGAHQAESTQPDRRLLQRLVQGPNEGGKIFLVPEQAPRPGRPVQHVINQSSRRLASLSWHQTSRQSSESYVT